MESFIKKIAIEAGALIVKKFGHSKIQNHKSHPLDVVTQADLLSNHFLVGAIKKRYPTHGIIAEESGSIHADRDYVWVVDPLDGTINFANGIPLFAVLVALAYKGEIILSVIYDPVHNELFFAKKGKGAFLNGKRIFCTNQKKLEQSVGLLSDRIDTRRLKLISSLSKKNNGNAFSARMLSSIGISGSYVASGRSDWMISLRGKTWDYAPVVLLAQEAGCTVTNLQGKKWRLSDRELIIANKKLHSVLLTDASKI